jgi:TP901 family phage tail tape measure protein
MPFTPSGDEGINIEISADDDGASAAFADVERSALDMKTAVAGAGAVLAGAGVAGLAGATKAAADFESAMVEVEKVTNPETAEEMSASIREMAETIPLAQKELAGIAADAGRFGVEGPENIEKFTEATAKMASATDMNTDEAGQAFAKLAELTNTPISEVENLGSAINELSNNTATSAQEISDSMMRSAGALSQLGMSQTEIAGMSAALNEVSESSERAGTRMRRLGQEMMNPKKAGDLASALGMTEEEFVKMREESPDELMLRMAEAMKEGGDEADALKNALSTTSRQALSGMAQNIDGTRKALEMSSTAYEENTSVQEEFNAASDTFNKKLQTMKNRLRNVGIVMGNQILPVLTTAMDKLASLIDSFAKMNEEMDGLPALIMTIGAVLTGLGAIAVTVGPAIVGALSPILAPVAALTAAIGVLAYAWKNNLGGIRGATKDLWATLQPVFQNVKSILKTVLDDYAIPLAKRLYSVWKTQFSAVLAEVIETMGVLKNRIKIVLNVIQALWNRYGTQIKKIATTIFKAIELVVKTAMRAISTTIQVILNLIQGDFDEALSVVLDFWKTTFDDVLNFLTGSFLTGLKAGLKLIFKTGRDLFVGFGTFITNTIKNTFNGITSWIANTGQSLFSSAFGGIGSAIEGVIDSTISYIKNGITGAVNWIVNQIDETIQGAVDTFNEAVPDKLEIPEITVGGGELDIPSKDIPNPVPGEDGWTVGGGDLDIPSQSVGGQSMDMPQLAEGGIVDQTTIAMIGEAGKEAVVPLEKLDHFLDTAFQVGMQSASLSPTPAPTPAGSGSGGSKDVSLTASLRVEGDDKLAEIIREHAEIVVDENEQDKHDRMQRF